MAHSMNDIAKRLPAASRPAKKDSGIKMNDGEHLCRACTTTHFCNPDHDARTPCAHDTRKKDKMASYAVRGRIRYTFQDGLTVSLDLDGIDQ